MCREYQLDWRQKRIHVVQCDRSSLLLRGFSAHFFWRKKNEVRSRSNTSGILCMTHTAWGFPDIAEIQPHCATLALLRYCTERYLVSCFLQRCIPLLFFYLIIFLFLQLHCFSTAASSEPGTKAKPLLLQRKMSKTQHVGVNGTLGQMISLPDKLTFGNYGVSAELWKHAQALTYHLYQRSVITDKHLNVQRVYKKCRTWSYANLCRAFKSATAERSLLWTRVRCDTRLSDRLIGEALINTYIIGSRWMLQFMLQQEARR